MDTSVEKFTTIIDHLNADKGKSRYLPLVNVTFFMGAGFSKSWDDRHPTGAELFSLSSDEIWRDLNQLPSFLESQGFVGINNLEQSQIKDIVYNLSMQLKYPDIRTRYTDYQSIHLILSELKYLIQKKFESFVNINYFDPKLQKFPLPPNINEEQKNILDLFSLLQQCEDGSNAVPEGIRFNFITTNYDFVIETVLDNIISEEDSQFLYTYCGVTPSRVAGYKNPKIVHSHFLVNNLIKINGGFEIIREDESYHFDYRARSKEKVMQNAPILMLPNREQDYTDSYFSAVFPKASRLLQESKVLVIVGYSMPEEDALLRLLLKQFAEDQSDLLFKDIFYISTADDTKLEERLLKVYPYLDSRHSKHSVSVFSGSFGTWAGKVVERLK
jgi:hypothetical protein